MSDDKTAQGSSSIGQRGTTLTSGSRTAASSSPEAQHERLERALAELLAVDRARTEEPSRYRRLVGVTTIISIIGVLVIIGGLLALSHLSPKVVNGASSPSTSSPSPPTTTAASVPTTLSPPGGLAGASAISTIAAASRDRALTSTVGEGGQPMLLLRTTASSFITTPTATPVVEYLWSARCGACGLENLVVASSLIELGGTFKGMSALSFGGSFSSVGFGMYRGPVDFEPVEMVGPPGEPNGTPTPQAKSQYELYDASPYTTSKATLPFLDVASHYVTVGSSVPSDLASGLTLRQIAAALQSGHGSIAHAIIGSANILTASICATLSDLSRPLPSICLAGEIQQLAASLPTSPPGHS